MIKKYKIMAMISSMSAGGAQRIVMNNLYDFQDDPDIDFTLFVYDKKTDSSYDHEIEMNKLNVVYLNNPRSYIKIGPLRNILDFFVINWNWYKAIKEYRPDVVHTHISEILPKCCIVIALAKIKSRFSTLHSNPYRYSGIPKIFNRLAFKYLGFVPICLTKEQAYVAKKQYGFENYEIVHNGVDFEKINKSIVSIDEARATLGISRDKYVVLCVGRLTAIKNYSFMLDVFAKLLKKNSKAILVFAGDGEEKQNLKKKAAELGLVENVVFLGNVSNVTTAYCAADVLAMPSISEASPLTLLEAQSCGVRAVISSGVPRENIITNNVFGLNENAKIDEWVDALLSHESNIVCEFSEEDFEIHKMSYKIKELYLKSLRNS